MARPEKQANIPVQAWLANAFASAVDAITGALQVIDTVHHEVHEGETFLASYKSPEGGDIADDANIEILFITGAKECHLTFIIAGGGDAEIYLGEDTTVSDNGTGLVAQNMKRSGSNDATASVYHTPTGATAGTQLENAFLPGGTGGNASGGTARRDTEWIFKINTQYLIRGINRGGGAKAMSIVVQWYEEEPE